MINAGKYNKKIEILGIKPVKDKGGFKKDEEYIVLKTYASIKTTRGYTLIQMIVILKKHIQILL